MSLASYTELQGAVLVWLRRPDLTPVVSTLITMGEGQLNRDLRCQQMVKRTTSIIAAQVVSAPDDFLAAKSMRITDFNPPRPLAWVSTEQMDELLSFTDSTGCPPRHYTVEGDAFRFSPDPGEGPYTAELSYYARLPALSTGNPTNWLLTSNPDVYLYAALLNSAPYLKADDRLQMWAAIYQRLVDALNKSGSGAGGRLDPMPSTYRSGGTP